MASAVASIALETSRLQRRPRAGNQALVERIARPIEKRHSNRLLGSLGLANCNETGRGTAVARRIAHTADTYQIHVPRARGDGTPCYKR